MFLTIVQPIATLHNTDGTLKAVRVFKAKVEYRDVCPKVSGKVPVRFTDLEGLLIDEILEQEVIDVSMEDLTENKRIRSMITCKPRSMTHDDEATLRGTFAMPAIKADGTVINPEIYQVFGSICYMDDGCTVSMRNIMYIDYKGTVYTGRQMAAKTPQVFETAMVLLHGIRVKAEDHKYTLFYRNDKSYGIGNIVAGKNRPAACMSYKAIDCADVSFMRAASATALCTGVPVEQCKSSYSSTLKRVVTRYNVYDKDIKAETEVLDVPYGFEAATVEAQAAHNLRTIALSNGVLSLVARTQKVPHVVEKTPLLEYHVEAKCGSEIEVPLIQGIPGAALYTHMHYVVEQQEYIEKAVSLANNIYDAAAVDIAFGTQCSSTVTVPLVKSTCFNMPITRENTSIALVPGQAKIMPPFLGKRSATLCFYLGAKSEHNILIKAQGTKRDTLDIQLMREDVRVLSGKIVKAPSCMINTIEPAPKATSVHVALTEGIATVNATISDNVSLKVMNREPVSATLAFVTSAVGEPVTNEAFFAESLTQLDVLLTANPVAKFIVRTPHVNRLRIVLPQALRIYMHRRLSLKDMRSFLTQEAKSLDIYTQVDREHITVLDAEGVTLPRVYLEPFIQFSLHDVGV